MTANGKEPLPHFSRRRMGVSELYASLLMLGATLSLGSFITAAAVGQFGLATSSSAASSLVEQRSSGKLMAFVYATTATPGPCPQYAGSPEGSTLVFAVFDYGSSAFTPMIISVNGTIYTGAFPSAQPGGLATYQVTLTPAGTCVHTSGQTVMLSDPSGDEFEFET
ncbi:MAG: hypothetical protein HY296_01015 [Thaumarchaeota archaeon]|nr:hypothetical protein [Nitrososphaerota archaeon]